MFSLDWYCGADVFPDCIAVRQALIFVVGRHEQKVALFIAFHSLGVFDSVCAFIVSNASALGHNRKSEWTGDSLKGVDIPDLVCGRPLLFFLPCVCT